MQCKIFETGRSLSVLNLEVRYFTTSLSAQVTSGGILIIVDSKNVKHLKPALIHDANKVFVKEICGHTTEIVYLFWHKEL